MECEVRYEDNTAMLYFRHNGNQVTNVNYLIMNYSYLINSLINSNLFQEKTVNADFFILSKFKKGSNA